MINETRLSSFCVHIAKIWSCGERVSGGRWITTLTLREHKRHREDTKQFVCNILQKTYNVCKRCKMNDNADSGEQSMLLSWQWAVFVHYVLSNSSCVKSVRAERWMIMQTRRSKTRSYNDTALCLWNMWQKTRHESVVQPLSNLVDVFSHTIHDSIVSIFR